VEQRDLGGGGQNDEKMGDLNIDSQGI